MFQPRLHTQLRTSQGKMADQSFQAKCEEDAENAGRGGNVPRPWGLVDHRRSNATVGIEEELEHDWPVRGDAWRGNTAGNEGTDQEEEEESGSQGSDRTVIVRDEEGEGPFAGRGSTLEGARVLRAPPNSPDLGYDAIREVERDFRELRANSRGPYGSSTPNAERKQKGPEAPETPIFWETWARNTGGDRYGGTRAEGNDESEEPYGQRPEEAETLRPLYNDATVEVINSRARYEGNETGMIRGGLWGVGPGDTRLNEGQYEYGVENLTEWDENRRRRLLAEGQGLRFSQIVGEKGRETGGKSEGEAYQNKKEIDEKAEGNDPRPVLRYPIQKDGGQNMGQFREGEENDILAEEVQELRAWRDALQHYQTRDQGQNYAALGRNPPEQGSNERPSKPQYYAPRPQLSLPKKVRTIPPIFQAKAESQDLTRPAPVPTYAQPLSQRVPRGRRMLDLSPERSRSPRGRSTTQGYQSHLIRPLAPHLRPSEDHAIYNPMPPCSAATWRPDTYHRENDASPFGHPRVSDHGLLHKDSSSGFRARGAESHNQAAHVIAPSSRRRLKEAPKYQGTSEITDFLAQFGIIAEYNQWDMGEKGLHLAMSLDGEARGILTDLAGGDQSNFLLLKTALLNRYAPPGREARFELELYNRVMQKTDTAVTYGDSLRKLAREAYPTMKIEERILCGLFIKGLKNKETRRFVHLQNPANMNEAIRLATTFDTFEETSTDGLPKKPRYEIVNTIEERPRHLATYDRRPAPAGSARGPYHRNAPSIICWNCGNKGHLSRNCTRPSPYEAYHTPDSYRHPGYQNYGPGPAHHPLSEPHYTAEPQGPSCPPSTGPTQTSHPQAPSLKN